ncbi:lysozyme inhibitor LprI family protein [Paraburkholderia sp.]|uniref:lysozyme inhibitor LprI family protein n=1 Tax=Paraburkholderia sp. TaxID=1926495 RepID=UPI0039E5A66E
MMRATSIFIILFFIANAAHASSSIYGSAFDYKKATPTRVHFPGKTREQIAEYCKQEMLGTMELSACAQFRYEIAIDSLNERISEVEKILQADDRENGEYEEPAALPFFIESQKNWELYRDNDCYSDTYSVGQASLRFVYFWDCMTRITKNRLDELTKPDTDD